VLRILELISREQTSFSVVYFILSSGLVAFRSCVDIGARWDEVLVCAEMGMASRAFRVPLL
jgi:hypothetical protein